MILGSVRRTIWHLTHRRFTSAEDYFRKRTRFGEINEFFKFQVISSDHDEYTLPFLTNPFRSRQEKGSWSHRLPLDYEYTNEHPERENALRHFDIAYDFVKDRVEPDCEILDVGCSTGFFLDQWHKKGFTNLHGLDPHEAAVDWAHEHRPHLDIKQGFFGPPENDIECDLLVFFKPLLGFHTKTGCLMPSTGARKNTFSWRGWKIRWCCSRATFTSIWLKRDSCASRSVLSVTPASSPSGWKARTAR